MPKQSETQEITIKSASKELDISESTIKKYLKDFQLSLEGHGAKATMTQETFQALKEIVKLRANGLSIQEIKELKAQEPTKSILDEVEETAKDIVKEAPQKEEEISSDQMSETNIAELNAEVDSTENADEELKELENQDDVSENEREETRGEEPARRRGFNYRYVERQVSMDSKRVSSIRLRLKNPNLPPRDKLFFEEALERRILFLNGWKHILKWIAKG